MIENAIGTISLPLGVATNFKINGISRLVPMATEEPSVVSVASKIAKIALNTGGFYAFQTESLMRGQIQVIDVLDPYAAMGRLYERKQEILEL